MSRTSTTGRICVMLTLGTLVSAVLFARAVEASDIRPVCTPVVAYPNEGIIITGSNYEPGLALQVHIGEIPTTWVVRVPVDFSGNIVPTIVRGPFPAGRRIEFFTDANNNLQIDPGDQRLSLGQIDSDICATTPDGVLTPNPYCFGGCRYIVDNSMNSWYVGTDRRAYRNELPVADDVDQLLMWNGHVWRLKGTAFWEWLGQQWGPQVTDPRQPTPRQDQPATAVTPKVTVLQATVQPVLLCRVPRLKGQRPSKANRRLKAAGCRIGKTSVRGQRRRGRKLKVKSQSIVPGTEVPRGTAVNLRLGY